VQHEVLDGRRLRAGLRDPDKAPVARLGHCLSRRFRPRTGISTRVGWRAARASWCR
jgi:hypothetical protein